MTSTPSALRSLLCPIAGLIVGLSFAAAGWAQDVKWVNAFPNLTFERPLELLSVPDGSGRLIIVEQAGRVLLVPNDPGTRERNVVTALDLAGPQVSRQGNEEGMLGLALHPDFANNRQVVIHYSASKPRRGVVSRFTFDEGLQRIDPQSERVVMEVPQPFSNHNGGAVVFGPDGYLYIGLGDGGSAGDPKDNGQNLGTLLGGILRIDLDGRAGNTKSPEGDYWVPADNPFVGRAGAAPETFAYGLRNPWRFSFDPETGRLWCGDVGQNKFEEITLVRRGGNHGWRIKEAFDGFKPDQAPDPPAKLLDPVVAHPRQEAGSITGGHVYRGDALPLYNGAYLYGDYVTGRMWALWYDGRVRQHLEIAKLGRPASFGVDADGEFYACDFVDEAKGPGVILKLVAD